MAAMGISRSLLIANALCNPLSAECELLLFVVFLDWLLIYLCEIEIETEIKF